MKCNSPLCDGKTHWYTVNGVDKSAPCPYYLITQLVKNMDYDNCCNCYSCVAKAAEVERLEKILGMTRTQAYAIFESHLMQKEETP